MKKLILLAIIPLAFSACQKLGPAPSNSAVMAKDTIPDTGLFYLRLVKDSTKSVREEGYVETAVEFDHQFHLYYDGAEDSHVPDFDPNLVVLGITSDGQLVQWDGIPYAPGVTIPIFVQAATGPYFLKISLLRKIPADINIWCRDNYLKDSLNLRKGNYNFNVDRADANTFGKKRFQIIIRPQ